MAAMTSCNQEFGKPEKIDTNSLHEFAIYWCIENIRPAHYKPRTLHVPTALTKLCGYRTYDKQIGVSLISSNSIIDLNFTCRLRREPTFFLHVVYFMLRIYFFTGRD
jgi:hypothetical protein